MRTYYLDRTRYDNLFRFHSSAFERYYSADLAQNENENRKPTSYVERAVERVQLKTNVTFNYTIYMCNN